MRGLMQKAIVFAVAAVAANSPATAETWTVIRAGHVITDARRPPMGPATIVVKDGHIERVVAGHPAPETIVTAAADRIESIDLGNRYVLPGLIDAHVHLASNPRDPYWHGAVKTEADNALV